MFAWRNLERTETSGLVEEAYQRKIADVVEAQYIRSRRRLDACCPRPLLRPRTRRRVDDRLPGVPQVGGPLAARDLRRATVKGSRPAIDRPVRLRLRPGVADPACSRRGGPYGFPRHARASPPLCCVFDQGSVLVGAVGSRGRECCEWCPRVCGSAVRPNGRYQRWRPVSVSPTRTAACSSSQALLGDTAVEAPDPPPSSAGTLSIRARPVRHGAGGFPSTTKRPLPTDGR